MRQEKTVDDSWDSLSTNRMQKRSVNELILRRFYPQSSASSSQSLNDGLFIIFPCRLQCQVLIGWEERLDLQFRHYIHQIRVKLTIGKCITGSFVKLFSYIITRKDKDLDQCISRSIFTRAANSLDHQVQVYAATRRNATLIRFFCHFLGGNHYWLTGRRGRRSSLGYINSILGSCWLQV